MGGSWRPTGHPAPAAQRDAGKRLADLGAEDLQAAGIDPALLERLDPTAAAERRAARFGK